MTRDGDDRSFLRRQVFASWPGFVLVLVVLLLFHGLPASYWRDDDPALLVHALHSPGLAAFYDPLDWRKLSPSSLTPWLTLSFKADLWIAGLSPFAFYVHQLLSLWLVGLATYALMRLWVPAAWAIAGATLFLVGAPTIAVTELLMTRHYLEGLLFAVLALVAFELAVRRRSTPWSCAAAFAYALAATAKEIYLPLLLVALVLPPVGAARDRLRLSVPMIAVAVLYVGWRRYMLGESIGGYVSPGLVVSTHSVIGLVEAVSRFPQYLFGSWWPLPTLAFLLLLGLAVWKRPALLVLVIVLTLSLLLPLVPLVSYPGISGPDRYLFLLWFACALSFVLLVWHTVGRTPRRLVLTTSAGVALCVLAIVAALAHSVGLAAGRQDRYREFEAQGRFLTDRSADSAYLPTDALLASYWYATRLCQIKASSGSSCPVALIRGFAPVTPVERLYAYSAAERAMVDVTDRLPDEIARVTKVDLTRPLEVSVRIDNGRVHWELGPYTAGQYYAASPQIGRFPIARTGELKIAYDSFAFHVQYQSPEGWTTSSPQFSVQQGSPASWRREPR